MGLRETSLTQRPLLGFQKADSEGLPTAAVSVVLAVLALVMAPFLPALAADSAPGSSDLAVKHSYSVFHGKIPMPVSYAQGKGGSTGKNKRTPALTELKFQKTNDNQGLWKGRVKGNGPVELALLIYERGALRIKRTIGLLDLEPREGAISFHFRSPLPKFAAWSWKVVAQPSV
ncbi:MAG: hypothetical protein KDD64_13335 [Bdellovibrionales bacterium]|nr:hypothetical protein [Bdellovibrionales bacterium]